MYIERVIRWEWRKDGILRNLEVYQGDSFISTILWFKHGQFLFELKNDESFIGMFVLFLQKAGQKLKNLNFVFIYFSGKVLNH